MKKNIIFFLIFCITFTAFELNAKKLNILLLGSSQIYYNRLDFLIDQIFSYDASYDVKTVASNAGIKGGYNLKMLWDCNSSLGDPKKIIANPSDFFPEIDHWDYVIIQEYYSNTEHEIIHYSEKFFNYIISQKNNPNVKVIFFALGFIRDTYPWSFIQAHTLYKNLVQKLGPRAILAPGSNAILSLAGENPTDEVIGKYYYDLSNEDYHPSAEASFLYACNIYCAITNKNPENLNIHDFSFTDHMDEYKTIKYNDVKKYQSTAIRKFKV